MSRGSRTPVRGQFRQADKRGAPASHGAPRHLQADRKSHVRHDGPALWPSPGTARPRLRQAPSAPLPRLLRRRTARARSMRPTPNPTPPATSPPARHAARPRTPRPAASRSRPLPRSRPARSPVRPRGRRRRSSTRLVASWPTRPRRSTSARPAVCTRSPTSSRGWPRAPDRDGVANDLARAGLQQGPRPRPLAGVPGAGRPAGGGPAASRASAPAPSWPARPSRVLSADA